MFIEIQVHASTCQNHLTKTIPKHGREVEEVTSKMNEACKSFYESAIDVPSKRDPIKRKIF